MENIKVIFIIIFIWILISFGMYSCSLKISKIIYNNGIHEGCGGHWVYEMPIGHQHITSFLYRYDKCGLTVELEERY